MLNNKLKNQTNMPIQAYQLIFKTSCLFQLRGTFMKILIVDDSKAMRKVVKWILRQAEIEADELLEASSSEDGLQQVETKHPDLVITDWNMPNMGGLEFLKALRETNNSVTFGFVTTQATTKVRNIAKDAGADFIISSPSTLNSFKQSIKPAL